MQTYLLLNKLGGFTTPSEKQLFQFFREQLIFSVGQKDPESYCSLSFDLVLTRVLLIPFNLKAIHADGNLKDFFEDIPQLLLALRTPDATAAHPFWSDIERFLSYICQLSSLEDQELDKIKAAYGEEYFNLLAINVKEYEEVD